MNHTSITQVTPPGNIHAACLDHVARAFSESSGLPWFKARNTNAIKPGAIIIGAHLLGKTERLPPGCVIWNTEQVSANVPWIDQHYIDLLEAAEVWDYSQRNVMEWRQHDVTAKWVPLGYCPSMESPALAKRSRERLVVYGSTCDRRRAVAEKRGAVQLPVCYGAALDAELATAAAVLNVHYYTPGIFEIVRCSYLFANAIPVISEASADDWFWPALLPEGTFHEYDDLLRVFGTASGEAQRDAYRRLPMTDILASVL